MALHTLRPLCKSFKLQVQNELSVKMHFSLSKVFRRARSLGVVCLTPLSGVDYYAFVQSNFNRKKTLLHLMQITIENNITNILFYPATEIKLYRHQMRTLSGRKGNYKFLQFKNVFSLARSFCCFDCGNIKFHCICGWTWIFRHRPMISLLFF